jgi:hypothetical protein
VYSAGEYGGDLQDAFAKFQASVDDIQRRMAQVGLLETNGQSGGAGAGGAGGGGSGGGGSDAGGSQPGKP